MSSAAPPDPTSGPPTGPFSGQDTPPTGPFSGQDGPAPRPSHAEVVPAPRAGAPGLAGPRTPGGPPSGTRTARRLRLGGSWLFWVSLVLGALLAALTVTSIVQVATTGDDALGDAQRITGQPHPVTVSEGDEVGIFAEAATPVAGVCTVTDGAALERELTLLPGSDVRYGGQPYELLATWTAPADATYQLQCDQDGLLVGDAQPVSQLPWWTAGIVIGALGTVAALLPLLVGGVLWLAGKVHRDLVR
jgi:hypothetical protein